MACLSCNKKGRYTIQWRSDGRRPTIYLGPVPKRFAEEYFQNVELLLEYKLYGGPLNPKTRQWLSQLAIKFRKKLSAGDLIEGLTGRTIAHLCDYCISQADVEPSTMRKYRDAKTNLISFFGERRDISNITPGDADEFRKWLKLHGRRGSSSNTKPLSSATVSKRCQQAKQFFLSAVRKRWISDNPFDGQRGWVAENRDRMHFVDRESINAIMKEADPPMRLVIGLARYAGLRTPSEIYPLEWQWVNFDQGVLTVLSPKMKRFEHKRWRQVPIFPELRVILDEAYALAPDGATHLFANTGITDTALRNRLERICRHAGVVPWPKL